MADRITILEWLNLPGGALDGSWDPERGFVIRGDPEMEEHFECVWDLFRSVLLAEILGRTAMEAGAFHSCR
ncbi:MULTISPECIES: oleate hydratase [Bradyrhizobium]|uniref:oleate hydratase n=1 Tax=Bradyrhizobium TaxID=374 RepID=UPI00211EB7EB|nr:MULTISPECIES: oleate hydratase [Bradyrhizobium]